VRTRLVIARQIHSQRKAPKVGREVDLFYSIWVASLLPRGGPSKHHRRESFAPGEGGEGREVSRRRRVRTPHNRADGENPQTCGRLGKSALPLPARATTSERTHRTLPHCPHNMEPPVKIKAEPGATAAAVAPSAGTPDEEETVAPEPSGKRQRVEPQFQSGG
jgi:hypothetical protein